MDIGDFIRRDKLPADLTIVSVDGHWVEGKYKDHVFLAKVYSEPSEFGINDGHVSKLSVLKKGLPNIKFGWGQERTLYNYDRGVDIDDPIGAEIAGVLDKALTN